MTASRVRSPLHRAARALVGLLVSAGAALLAAAAVALPGLQVAPVAIASAPSACTTSGLVIWLNDLPGGGTAGSIYYKLELTNLSGHTCTLRGYPGVSAVNLRGHQLGAAGARETSRRARTVTLANGSAADAVLRITDAGALPACSPATAAGLRVYPPGQGTAKVVPFPFQACSRAGQSDLAVQALALGP